MHRRQAPKRWLGGLVLVLAGLPGLTQASPGGDDAGLGQPFVLSPIPAVRLALGPGWGQSPGDRAEPDLCFTWMGGPRLLLLHRLFEPGFWLQPELGYSFRRTRGEYEHQFNLGLALGYTLHPDFGLGYMVGFSAGNLLQTGGDALLSQTAVGVRHGLRLTTLLSLLSLEVSHQALVTTAGGATYHDLRLLLGLDLGLVAYGLGNVILGRHG